MLGGRGGDFTFGEFEDGGGFGFFVGCDGSDDEFGVFCEDGGGVEEFEYFRTVLTGVF